MGTFKRYFAYKTTHPNRMDITWSSTGIFQSILTIGNKWRNFFTWELLGNDFVTLWLSTHRLLAERVRVPCGGSMWPFPTNRHFDQIQFNSPSSNPEQERRHIQCSYQNYHVRFTDGFTLLVGTNIHYWDIPNFCQKGQKNESTLVAPDELKPGGGRWNWY